MDINIIIYYWLRQVYLMGRGCCYKYTSDALKYCSALIVLHEVWVGV